MVREVLELGMCPTDEEDSCPQVGDPDYYEKVQAMCSRFIQDLDIRFGHAPKGSRLTMYRNNHEFGTYYEVVYRYYQDNPIHSAYAQSLENNYPSKWLTEEEKTNAINKVYPGTN